MTDMTPYWIGWAVLIGASFLVSLMVFIWLRSMLGFFSRLLTGTLLFVSLTVPAPIPNFQGFFAPAYVVFIFETFFQIKGSSEMSAQVLILALVGAFILMMAVRYWSYKKKGKFD